MNQLPPVIKWWETSNNATIPLCWSSKELSCTTTQNVTDRTQCKCKSHIKQITFTAHLGFGFSYFQNIEHRRKSRSYTSSKSDMEITTLSEAWFPRDTLRDMEKDRWLNHSFTSCTFESKISNNSTTWSRTGHGDDSLRPDVQLAHSRSGARDGPRRQ